MLHYLFYCYDVVIFIYCTYIKVLHLLTYIQVMYTSIYLRYLRLSLFKEGITRLNAMLFIAIYREK